MCVCEVTGEGEGVRGVMLQSFRAVAGEEGADALSPGRTKRDVKMLHRGLMIKISLLTRLIHLKGPVLDPFSDLSKWSMIIIHTLSEKCCKPKK